MMNRQSGNWTFCLPGDVIIGAGLLPCDTISCMYTLTFLPKDDRLALIGKNQVFPQNEALEIRRKYVNVSNIKKYADQLAAVEAQ